MVTTDEEDFDLTFHVVPDDYMDSSIVLGKSHFPPAEGLSITKFTKNGDVHMIMRIDLVEKPELDIEETVSENAKLILTTMFENYKTKTTNVEMRIVLKDETQIYCNTRHLPLKEHW